MLQMLTVTVVLCAFARPAYAACDAVGQVRAGTILYHGTPVAMFNWQNPQLNPAPPFSHPASPSGPAWFAADWEFSIHAGVRFLMGRSDTSLVLYRYTVQTTMSALICRTMAELSAFTHIPDSGEDVEMARQFCARYKDQYNAYVLLEDAVRREPEYIICDPAARLKLDGQRQWWVTQVRVGGDTYTGASGKDFTDREMTCLLNNANLGDFRCRAG
jgi:hypothetical protein